MFLLVLLLLPGCLCYIQTIEGSVKVHPISVHVEEGQGFLINYPPLIENDWISCDFTLNRKTYPFPAEGTFEKIEDFGKVSRIMTENNCGIQVSDVGKGANGKWSIRGFRRNDKGDKGTDISVNVLAKSSEEKNCQSVFVKSNFCEKMDSFGRRFPCGDDNLPTPNKYTCRYGVEGSMIISQVNIRPQGVEETVKERVRHVEMKFENNRQILECIAPQWMMQSVSSCVITHRATGEMYQIKDGLIHARFSSYFTNIGQGICQFATPENKHFEEEGAWILQMTNRENESFECQFNVGDSRNFVEEQRERAKKETVLNTKTKSIQIKCAEKVPYPLTKCFLQRPFPPTLQFATDEAQLLKGSCVFNVYANMANETEFNFKCGFNSPSPTDPDIEIPFRVRKFNDDVIDGRYSKEDRTLECHQIFKLSIQGCFFVSPSGKLYSVPSDQFRSREFDYHGPVNGFHKGACGIRINEGNIEKGFWKCAMWFNKHEFSYHTSIQTDENYRPLKLSGNSNSSY